MSKEISYDIRADIDKNRLYITFKGFFPENLTVEIADKTIAEATKLKPGFVIINDITQTLPTSGRGAEQIQRVQEFMRQQGVRRVIRIVDPKNVLARVQFERTGKDAGYTIPVDVVGSLEEALRLLEE
ncbi:MAG: hypothetical protein AB1439_00980 [candidate division FCPU426 bacterium]